MKESCIECKKEGKTNESLLCKECEDKVEHIKCSLCNRQLSSFDEVSGELIHDTHFDLSRNRKVLEVNDLYVEEDMSERNCKMLRYICEGCFVQLLNENEKLGKLFLFPDKDCFIY